MSEIYHGGPTVGSIEMGDDTLKLEITLEGDAPGLVAHHLSVSAFGPAFQQLLAALRRIVSSYASAAYGGDTEYGVRGGRYSRLAEQVDLEISDIRGNSPTTVDLTFAVNTPMGASLPLFQNDLIQRAGEELMTALDSESRGERRQVMVRQYFEQLPIGLTHQRYKLWKNGKELKTVDVGEVDLSDTLKELPYFVRLHGSITGVGFHPGPLQVRIKSEERQWTLVATQAQVEEALRLREKEIVALAVTGARDRLLWLKSADDEPSAPPRDVSIARLDRRWGRVLDRLAS